MSIGPHCHPGRQGMLGSDLRESRKQGLNVQIFRSAEVDITSEPAESVRLLRSASLIVNARALYQCRKSPKVSPNWRTASTVTRSACWDAWRIRGSRRSAHRTIFVFDGVRTPPIRKRLRPTRLALRRSKLLGERLLAESGCPAASSALKWTYGKHGVNFITKILNAARTQPLLRSSTTRSARPRARVTRRRRSATWCKNPSFRRTCTTWPRAGMSAVTK